MRFGGFLGQVLAGGALLLLVASLGVAQTTYYVANGGDDNPGKGTTTTDPFETIQYAVDQSTTGDTVKVKRGEVFIEDVLINGFNGTSSNVFTLEAYGSGNDPIIRASTGDVVTLYVKNSDYVYINDFDLDGDSVGEKGLYIQDSDHVYPTDVDVDDYDQRGVVIRDSSDCTLTNCDVTNTERHTSDPLNEDGTGIFIRGNSDRITLYTCTISNNEFDGVACNPYSASVRIDDLELYYCTVESNDRQGFRGQEVDGLQINGGDYRYNEKTGIQIEVDCSDVYIYNVDASFNASPDQEAGIWISDTYDATLVDCFIDGREAGSGPKQNRGILVTQSELVDIDNCDVQDCKHGIEVATGANYFHLTGGSPSEPYTPILDAGVRFLTIHADCGFSNNDEDIRYGDDRVAADDEYFMRYHDNEYLGTSASIDSLPFDLINGGGHGYVADKLEDLQ